MLGKLVHGMKRRSSPALCVSRRRALAMMGQHATMAGCALLLGACANGSASPAVVGSIGTEGSGGLDGKNAVKIAILLPLSGGPQTAAVAKALQQAGELALFENNGSNLQLIVKDDKGTEAGARAAAEEAVKSEAELIIGPVFAKSVAAAAPVARHAGIPMIAFSNDTRVAGHGVYLLSFLASQEVPRIVAYAASQGRRRFAALLPEDASGKVVEPLFKNAVERSGGTVVATEYYAVDINGMIEPARRMRDLVQTSSASGAPVDALFLPGGADTLPLLGPLLPRSDFDGEKLKLIGTGGWDYPNASRERLLQNGWFAAPDPRGWREFSERFAKANNSMPPRLASLAYDAVSVAAALSSGSKGSRYTAANLTRASGFTGIDGPFRFQASGLSERSLAVLEMGSYGPNVVDPAPPGWGVPQAFANSLQAGFN
jgi:ABC-type branched-subunit amino acid transport system substrate-binding protein